MFKLFKDKAVVSRVWTYVDDAWNKKSWGFIPTWDTYKWLLKPIEPEDALYVKWFWKNFQFITKRTADIQESDRLVIDSVEYEVKAEAPWEGITIKYKKILLVLKK